MTVQMQIHKKALEVVSKFKKAEADMLEVLQQIDEQRVYLHYECKSLFEYVLKELKLSESTSFNFITVARKAKEIPELKDAIKSGELSVSKARKITPVINNENKSEWIQLAVTLPQRRLEQEVARVSPKEITSEKMNYVTGDRLKLQLGVSSEVSQKLKRAQDLESQKLQRAATLEETLEALLEVYLKNNDPVQKAEKIKKRTNLSVTRQVELRDQWQCTYKDANGRRCQERRWLHTHHIIPKSLGGSDTLENLTTLCSGHHRLAHLQ